MLVGFGLLFEARNEKGNEKRNYERKMKASLLASNEEALGEASLTEIDKVLYVKYFDGAR